MCPECGEPLVAFELDGIEIDHCVACLGTWLDAGEIEMITHVAGVEPGGLSKALFEAEKQRRGERRCPRCRRRLTVIAVGETELIELDRCRKGHGLWFDQGELKNLIARFHDGEEGCVAQFFSELYRSELET